MLKMVDGTGIIGVDMICPLGISTPQPPNYDRVELEGTGVLVLPNSLDAPLERLELGGKTEQVQTTGKNLFDIETCPLEHNNTFFKIPISGGNVLLMSGYTFAENTQYTLSVSKVISKNNNSASFKFDYTDGTRSEVLVKDMPKKSLISTSGKTIKSVYIINPYGGSHEVFNLQVEEGSTAKPYEPYTGGKPAPSSEYPQEIKSVGKWNEATRKYEIEISISGRNLFDFSTCEEGKIFEGSGNIVSATNGVLTDFIPCFPNSQYSRSRTGSTVVTFYDCDKNKIGFEIVGNTTFVTPEKCRYFRFSALKTVVDYTKIVACPGQTVMDYEPYREPKFFTLTSDRPITKWDRLVEQGGQIGWLYGGKIIDSYNSEQIDAEYVSSTGSLTVGATVLYKLKTTEFVPLPQSEQNAIRALTTHYPTTVITADGGELDPDIKVTYRKEI